MFFNKKRKLYDAINSKKIEHITKIIPNEPDDPDVLGIAWAHLAFLSVKDTILISKLGDKINDSTCFEMSVAASFFIKCAYYAELGFKTDFIEDQYLNSLQFRSNYSNEISNWKSHDIILYRLNRYNLKNDPVSVAAWFISCSFSDKYINIDYKATRSSELTSIDGMMLSSSLAGFCGESAKILYKTVDNFGFDPDTC
ncbi:hypothetical protein [Brevundimonas naejangsanensis]|uniref:hypothetical protein n=1 Tax=Brevundimonas naejangsanensis TaxID=588932 RepID=UPI0026EF95B2|nr:hypothetical protein [Brevundimonas naejangsanensis]